MMERNTVLTKVFCLDTNVLLYDAESIFAFEDNTVVIPLIVLEELDRKKGHPGEVGQNARRVSRHLDSLRQQGSLSDGVSLRNGGTVRITKRRDVAEELPEEITDNPIADNIILSDAYRLSSEYGDTVTLITKDINLRVKCDVLGIRCDDYLKHRVTSNKSLIYTGVRRATVEQSVVDKVYVDKSLIPPTDHPDFENLRPNEFVVMKSSPKASAAIGRYKGDSIVLLPEFPTVWGVKSRNKEQRFAFDLLFDPDIKLVTLVGPAGTGKTLLALTAGVHHVLEKNCGFNQLVVSRPVQPLGNDIGFLPGSFEEKMHPWTKPILDNLGYLFNSDKDRNGKSMVSLYFEKGIFEVEAITYLRGRSISNAFIIIDEAQNLSVHELKTIITRVGENTKIVLTGDVEQIDNNYVDSVSNGLTYAVEKFKDHDIAGHITLIKGQRSDLATLASKIL
jgi:PhoH-like ATPase